MSHTAVPRVEGAGSAAERPGRNDATSLVTIYLVALLAVPSNVSVGPWIAIGHPAVLWGLFLLFWWMLSRLQARTDVSSVAQPVRYAVAALAVVTLTSFAAALMRGQPADQVTPAISAVIRFASWTGALLVIMDGVRTHYGVRRLVRGLAVGGGALAALGLAQIATDNTLLDWIGALPMVNVSGGEFFSRSSFTRAVGTSMHPLEHTTVLATLLPIALVTAVFKGARDPAPAHSWLWWLPVGLMVSSAMTAVSRSATLGFGIALLATLPALPRVYRLAVLIGGAVLGFVIAASSPGMLGTVLGLFLGVSDDPSAQSRSEALARAPEFIAPSPFIGVGLGLFLPRYYIFDNQWVLLTVELGILGTVVFIVLGVAGIWSALWAARAAISHDMVAMGRAVAVTLLTTMVLFFFFDGLSFSKTAGLFFVALGLSAAVRAIVANDVARSQSESLMPYRQTNSQADPGSISPSANDVGRSSRRHRRRAR